MRNVRKNENALTISAPLEAYLLAMNIAQLMLFCTFFFLFYFFSRLDPLFNSSKIFVHSIIYCYSADYTPLIMASVFACLFLFQTFDKYIYVPFFIFNCTSSQFVFKINQLHKSMVCRWIFFVFLFLLLCVCVVIKDCDVLSCIRLVIVLFSPLR